MQDEGWADRWVGEQAGRLPRGRGGRLPACMVHHRPALHWRDQSPTGWELKGERSPRLVFPTPPVMPSPVVARDPIVLPMFPRNTLAMSSGSH